MPKLLNDLIEDYKQPYLEYERVKQLYHTYAAAHEITFAEVQSMGWKKREQAGLPSFLPTHHRWTEEDDRLIGIMTKLYQEGFDISSFRVKTDHTYLIRLFVKVMPRMEFVGRVCKAIGDDWGSIKFSKNAVWLRGKLRAKISGTAA